MRRLLNICLTSIFHKNMTTKIIATIGPATEKLETLQQLAKAGMNIARLNFSHGTYPWFEQVITRLKKISPQMTIMLDTKGPEIRTANTKNIHLEKNKSYTIGYQKLNDIPITYKNLHHKVRPKDIILLDSGLVKLTVTSVSEDTVTAVASNEEIITPKRHVNIPGVDLGLPVLSLQDKRDIIFGLEHGIHLVAVSFVTSAEDIGIVRREIAKHTKRHIPIIAKIETQLAIINIEEIIRASDGIMIARGDLGTEAGIIKIPSLERHLLQLAQSHKTPVIVATQMLASMVSNSTPTRAEAMDVGTAAYLGADAVMLSEESSVGAFPVESVRYMRELCAQNQPEYELPENISSLGLVQAGIYHAHLNNTRSRILLFTNSKETLLQAAFPRTSLPTLVFTEEESIYHMARLLRGLTPYFIKKGEVRHITENMPAMRTFVQGLLKNRTLRQGETLLTYYDLVDADGKLDTLQISHT